MRIASCRPWMSTFHFLSATSVILPTTTSPISAWYLRKERNQHCWQTRARAPRVQRPHSNELVGSLHETRHRRNERLVLADLRAVAAARRQAEHENRSFVLERATMADSAYVRKPLSAVMVSPVATNCGAAMVHDLSLCIFEISATGCFLWQLVAVFGDRASRVIGSVR